MPHSMVALREQATRDQIAAVVDAIYARGGRLVQTWDSDVLIVDGGPDLPEKLQELPGVAAASADDVPEERSLEVTAGARQVLAARNLGRSPQYLATRGKGGEAGISFDGVLAPSGCGGGGDVGTYPFGVDEKVSGILGRPERATVLPLFRTARRALVGTIGVAVVQIDGPAGTNAQFTAAEWTEAILALSRAFDGLYGAAPSAAHLVFETAIRHVSIPLDPTTVPSPADPNDPTPAEYESIESKWRDPALSRSAVVFSRSMPCVPDSSEARHGPTQAQWVAAAPLAAPVEVNP